MLPLTYPRLWIAGAVLIAAAIAVGSLLPGPLVAPLGVHDKIEHAGAYFMLTVWMTGFAARRRYGVAVLLAFLLGVLLELAQGWATATRFADPLDLLANSLGILLALLLAWLGLGGWAGRVERWLGVAPRS